MAAKPIKRSLLIHDVSYEERQNDNRWDEDYSPAVNVERVRVEPKIILITNSSGKSVQSNTTLFHDAVHSTACDFKVDSKVTFDGSTYTVGGVDYFYDNMRLHHKEVRLV